MYGSKEEFQNPNANHQYLENPGPQYCTFDTEILLDHLLLFFPNELFQQIVTETNLYHEQTLLPDKTRRSWAPIDQEEIKAFLGTAIAMGILNLPNVRSYWAKRLSQVPWLS